MRCLKIIFLIALFVWISPPLAGGQKVTGENEYFKFTVEFKDSTFASVYKDSSDLIKERAEIFLLLNYAELSTPGKYRKQADEEGFMPTLAKIRQLEKILEDSTLSKDEEKNIINGRDALAKIWDKLYELRQFDAVVPKYNK